MQNQEPRPPYVRFVAQSVEDREASIKAGHYVAKDIHVAMITVPGQKDTTPREVTGWLRDYRKQAEAGRIPAEWPERFERAYEMWSKGQELPPEGTPIKTWSVLSPAQRENLITVGILTVEDLANMTDEAARNLGIGAISLKQKAVAWLQESTSTGSLVEQNTALKIRVEEQQEQLDRMQQAIEDLKKLVPPEKLVKEASETTF